MANVKCIRLPAGEEVIGEVVAENDKTITIRTPASVLLVPGQGASSQVSIALMPWLPYSDDDSFDISKDKVLTMHNPSVELVNNYSRMFGTGIQIATAGSIPNL